MQWKERKWLLMLKTELNTPCGEIRGIQGEGFLEFRGIRYANAKRWEYPEQVTHWDGVYDALHYGNCCYQRRAFENDAECNPFYHKEFRAGMEFTYGEDCLFLNICAPENADNCPVIIYIHGGSFTGGSADEGHVSGTQFAKNGVIFVAINYRLGPYGFCSHPALTDKNGVCGNYGLYDQYVALKWIRDNISAFGGDVNRMTLLGQSAGAMSVDIQLSNPLCENWFSGAVMMSGAAIQRRIARPVMPEKTEKFWNQVIENAGCENIEQLRNADAKTLFYAWSDACRQSKLSIIYTLPVCDGKLVTRENFNMENTPGIPCILGVTITDMMPCVLEFLIKSWVKHAKGNKNYVYVFSRELPGDNCGAWHSCDLLYAFSTLGISWRPFDEIDRRISRELSQSLCAFAKTGDPNCRELPRWNPGVKAPMHFGEKSAPAALETKILIKNTFSKKGPM